MTDGNQAGARGPLPSPTGEGLKSLLPVWPILVGAATVLSLSLGLRQSLGLFMPPITSGPQNIGISVADFTAAVAVQNLAWGLLQPLAGAWSARIGFRPLMLAGAALYVAALLLLASAQGLLAVVLGAGVMIGASLACTGSALTLSVATRVVSPASRSLVLGVVSGVSWESVRRAMRCCMRSVTLGSVSPAAVEKAVITCRRRGGGPIEGAQ